MNPMAITSISRPRKSIVRPRRSRSSSTAKGWRGWMRTNWRGIATITVIAIGLSSAWGRLDIDQVHRQAEHIPALLAFALMVTLPLIGCPATIVNLCAGIRFGIVGGLPLVALAIFLHQLIAFQLVRWKPAMFGHLVDPIRKRLPKGSHGSVAVFSALIPGVPYWMQVYSMPLIGVPLRTVLLCCVPLHTIRSMIALVGGGISDHLTAGWLVGLGIYAVTLMGVCAYAGRQIRRQLAKTRSRKRPSTTASHDGEALRFQPALASGGK